jgi:hypothetical protein
MHDAGDGQIEFPYAAEEGSRSFLTLDFKGLSCSPLFFLRFQRRGAHGIEGGDFGQLPLPMHLLGQS